MKQREISYNKRNNLNTQFRYRFTYLSELLKNLKIFV